MTEAEVRAELPVVACTLMPADLRDRRRDWEQVLANGNARVRPARDGVRIHLEPGEEVATEIRRLAELEADCCGFARWTVRTRDDDTVLDVQSEGEGVEAVRAMFAPSVSGAA